MQRGGISLHVALLFLLQRAHALIVEGYLPLLPLHCPQNRVCMLIFDGSLFLSITATLPPSKMSNACSFSMEVYFFTYEIIYYNYIIDLLVK